MSYKENNSTRYMFQQSRLSMHSELGNILHNQVQHFRKLRRERDSATKTSALPTTKQKG